MLAAEDGDVLCRASKESTPESWPYSVLPVLPVETRSSWPCEAGGGAVSTGADAGGARTPPQDAAVSAARV